MVAGYFTRPEDKFDNSYTPLRYKLCCIFFAGMLCFFIACISTSFAFDYDTEKSNTTVAYSVAGLFCYLFEFLYDSLSGIGEAIAVIMDGKLFSMGSQTVQIPMTAFNDVFNSVVSAMKTIGFAVCLFFFIMTLIDLLTSERLSFEIFWKHFLKLILGVFMVDNAEKVKDFAIDFGNAFMKEVTLTNQTLDTNPFAQDSGFMKAITQFGAELPLGWLILFGLAFLLGLFPVLLGLVFKGAAILIGFSRLLELYLRCAFLPVALALMTDDGWRGAGGRYIKKIIAVSVQGVALIIIGHLVSSVCAGTLTNLTSNIYQYGDNAMISISQLLSSCFTIIIVSAGIGLAGLSLMFKSMGIINDVFGV